MVRRRFDEAQARLLVAEYRAGASLARLGRKHHAAKSSIYNYLAARGAVRKQRRVSRLLTSDPLCIGAYLGMWAGDGSRTMDKNGLYLVRFALHSEDQETHTLLRRLCLRLFNFEPNYWRNKGTLSADAALYSKFIYRFPQEYLTFGPDKCRTVALRKSPRLLGRPFMEGFLTGLAITDGSFSQDRFVFSTVSTRLAKQVIRVLRRLGYRPRGYLAPRRHAGWAPIWRIYLSQRQARRLRLLVNNTASELMGRPMVIRDAPARVLWA